MIRNVAVLGAGIGTAHVAGFLALPDRFRVSHICDLDAARAAELAQTAGAEPVERVETALAVPEVDIVDICLPPQLHAPVAEAALQAGKHVIVEKPLAGSFAAARDLAAVAEAAGRRVFPVFQYRYAEAFVALDALIAAGLAGRPELAALETHWNRGADYYAVPWRGTWAHELGGAVLSHAIHSHDLLRCYFGPVAEVSAMTATRINEIETEDCAAIALRMENGALATSSITLGAADDTSRLRFVFSGLTAESGTAPYAPGTGAWRFVARSAANQAEVDRIVAASSTLHDGFAGFFSAVADDLEGVGSAVTLEDGVASIELVSAIYEAARTGARVSLPLDASLAISRRLTP